MGEFPRAQHRRTMSGGSQRDHAPIRGMRGPVSSCDLFASVEIRHRSDGSKYLFSARLPSQAPQQWAMKMATDEYDESKWPDQQKIQVLSPPTSSQLSTRHRSNPGCHGDSRMAQRRTRRLSVSEANPVEDGINPSWTGACSVGQVGEALRVVRSGGVERAHKTPVVSRCWSPLSQAHSPQLDPMALYIHTVREQL